MLTSYQDEFVPVHYLPGVGELASALISSNCTLTNVKDKRIRKVCER